MLKTLGCAVSISSNRIAAGLPSYGIGQLSLLLVSRPCTKQAPDNEFLHVLLHFNSYESILLIRHEFSQGLAKFCFAHPLGSQEDERCYELNRIVQATPGAWYGLNDGLDGLPLSHDPICQLVPNIQDAFYFRFHESLWGYARPYGHHVDNIIRNELVTKHPLHLVLSICGGCSIVYIRGLIELLELFQQGGAV